MEIKKVRYHQTGTNMPTFKVETMDGEELTVPDSMGNKDRQAIEAWLEKGNEIDPFEQSWDFIRGRRDQLLKETDFCALSDSSLSEPMRVYRQELRDVPQDFATPDIVIFPNKPDE